MNDTVTDGGAVSSVDAAADDERSLSLLEAAIAVAKHKWLVLGTIVLFGLLSIAYVLLQPALYTAEAKILPPQQHQSATASLLGQIGALTGVTGGGLIGKNSNDLYVGMLKSRTVADGVIKRFDLQKRYEAKTPGVARRKLEGRTKILSSKENLISIAVDDTDPKVAALLANGFVDELYKLTQSLAVTEASQRRLFYERQLAQARENLSQAEQAARQALENRGISQVEGQGRAILETSARLRGQITVKEIQLNVMRTFASDSNPELLLAQKELETMRSELVRLEGGGMIAERKDRKPGGNDSFRLLRNVKYYETIQDLLGRQYELARIDEAKDASLIQVLDSAVEPETKSKPRRTLIVLLATLAGTILAVFLALMREAYERAGATPEHSARIATLKYYLRTR